MGPVGISREPGIVEASADEGHERGAEIVIEEPCSDIMDYSTHAAGLHGFPVVIGKFVARRHDA
jgi:hypothetical protein